MPEGEKRLKSDWWRQGAQIFGEVSAWVAIPIVFALIAGKALDKHFNSDPWIFLSLTGISFFISIGGIWKILSKYIKAIEEETRKINKEENKNGREN